MTRAGRILPGGTFGTQSVPAETAFVVDRGLGSKVVAVDGREYIDYHLGSGPLILGHAHPSIVEAVGSQAARGTHYHLLNEPAIELAERLVAHVPCAEAVKFVADGTQATFFALRLARAYTGRSRVLKFEGSYHGHHDYAVWELPPLATSDGSGNLVAQSAGVPSQISETVAVAPYNDTQTALECIERHRSDLAAVIVEPVQRALMPEHGFLEALQGACREAGAMLVFDEVVTGFRLGLGGAQQLLGVVPDLCALGKAMGGGVPIGAVVGRREILELASIKSDPTVVLSGTLNGNPLCAAAGLATIGELETGLGYRQMEEIGTAMTAGLVDLGKRFSVPLQVLGTAAQFEVVFAEHAIRDYRSYMETDRRAAVEFGTRLIAEGVLVRPGGKWYVSTVHSWDDAEATLDRAERALEGLATEAGAR